MPASPVAPATLLIGMTTRNDENAPALPKQSGGVREREMFAAALAETGLLGTLSYREKRQVRRAWLREYRRADVHPYPFLALHVTRFPADPAERTGFLRSAYARSVKNGWVDDELDRAFRTAIGD